MQPGAEEQPRSAAGFGIEPEKASGAGNSSSVPAGWLAEFDGSQEQQNLDDALAALQRRRQERIAEDVDLVTSLAMQGFTGRDYTLIATELAKHGNAVIIAWIRRGLIFARVRERGLGGLPEPPAGALNRPDVAEELAGRRSPGTALLSGEGTAGQAVGSHKGPPSRPSSSASASSSSPTSTGTG